MGTRATEEEILRSLCVFWRYYLRTVVYVDGFNLYYRMLRKRPALKWLNVKSLAEGVLSEDYLVTKVNYYTARVSGQQSQETPRKQNIYLKALQTEDLIDIHFGKFQTNLTYAQLCPKGKLQGAPLFKPMPNYQWDNWPESVRIIKREEKGSDVNLGVHLVRDAFLGKFDAAAVITNDLDLMEPIRIVTKELGKKVVLLSPVKYPVQDLKNVSSSVRYIHCHHLESSQFSNPIITLDGKSISKPLDWM